MPPADIGLNGLSLMGQSLALNTNDHGYKLVVYNRTQSATEGFVNGAAASRHRLPNTLDKMGH